MTPPPAAKTVWIVDDDLGFVWWLGELFTEAGCRALPALSSEQAISLMKKLDVGIDLLVVNPQLSGVGGLVQSLTRAHPKLKIIVIGELSRALATVIRTQANLARPAASEEVSRPEWVKKVKKLLKEVSVAAAV